MKRPSYTGHVYTRVVVLNVILFGLTIAALLRYLPDKLNLCYWPAAVAHGGFEFLLFVTTTLNICLQAASLAIVAFWFWRDTYPDAVSASPRPGQQSGRHRPAQYFNLG